MVELRPIPSRPPPRALSQLLLPDSRFLSFSPTSRSQPDDNGSLDIVKSAFGRSSLTPWDSYRPQADGQRPGFASSSNARTSSILGSASQSESTSENTSVASGVPRTSDRSSARPQRLRSSARLPLPLATMNAPPPGRGWYSNVTSTRSLGAVPSPHGPRTISKHGMCSGSLTVHCTK